jgi:hypothetical protein
MTADAKKSGMQRFSSLTLMSIGGSALAGAVLEVLGIQVLITGSFPVLFGISLIIIGGLAMCMAGAAYLGKRPAWAGLVALWGVLAFCAFFATPKVVDLEQLHKVTVEMELKLGRKKAEQKVDDENMAIRLQNLGACALFALPFGLLCAGLAFGGREYEPRVERTTT